MNIDKSRKIALENYCTNCFGYPVRIVNANVIASEA